ncbi:GerAB/ArcD/ProY family transporter [Paenibacillus sp. LHD-38]|uniref:GerAB/ArcD/ProY family transporter n=1 Tax=Paenibacillus sp. LHD-38 TaxID=3072143 RepID=UPI00280EF7DF|nr:GerAB/ArcD/ProY family transporter [Paenibacillus sp. LHD-38]MDQ8737746.1 GerAB/ArcD/ProY family transporter [Paenibacillus sp. LHD-38]
MSMKSWEYGDERIGPKETVFTIGSLIIGIGILTLPRTIALATNSTDGWISILMGGTAALLLAWMLGKLAVRINRRNYFDYTATLTAKPIAYLVSFIYTVYFLTFTSYITRSMAELSKQFLFERTPLEIILLSFLLVVIYAVSGSRIGIIRLAVLFLPFVLIVTGIFLLLSINLFTFTNLQPVFNTDFHELMMGAKETAFSFLGFESILFYGALMRKPNQAPKLATIAVLLSMFTYLLIYIFTIGIFSYEVTQNIVYPTLELAREVSVPGEFFERLESLFLIFWVVSIFATSSIALDITVQSTSYM